MAGPPGSGQALLPVGLALVTGTRPAAATALPRAARRAAGAPRRSGLAARRCGGGAAERGSAPLVAAASFLAPWQLVPRAKRRGGSRTEGVAEPIGGGPAVALPETQDVPASAQPRGLDAVPHDIARVFSIDVECVAIGRTHERSSRSPCELALVDGHGRLLLQQLIMPSEAIVSYLTPYTGLRCRGDLQRGNAVSLSEARARLRKHLPSNAVLVGQNPDGDVEWMGLRRGTDFAETVDLAEVFRAADGTVTSLQHEALVLLGRDMPRGRGHDPCWDAAVSVGLYHKAARASPSELEEMRTRLTSMRHWPPRPSTAQRYGYSIDGVCLSMYSAGRCTCGRRIEQPVSRC